MVSLRGFDPRSSGLQPDAMTTSAKETFDFQDSLIPQHLQGLYVHVQLSQLCPIRSHMLLEVTLFVRSHFILKDPMER